jgi:hypothetical protein
MALNRAALWELDPSDYQRHALHTQPRAFAEANCYVDLWIELLHAAGREPVASLACALATDFELDQFTFVKPTPADLDALYGLSVYELNLWRPLVDHALVQLGRGALVLAEVDSFYLPDTSGTDYRQAHVKTTIAIERLDLARRSLGYFHNAGYFALEGADFDGLFQLEPKVPDTHLPPYVEIVRFPRQPTAAAAELRARSLELARAHLRRRSRENPIARYRRQFEQDVEWLLARDLATFHRYAFSVLRQLGAGCELSALYLDWLGQPGEPDLRSASAAFHEIAGGSKALILKLARLVNSKRRADLGPMLDEMASSWERGMGELVDRLVP